MINAQLASNTTACLFRIGPLSTSDFSSTKSNEKKPVDWDRIIAVALLENAITVLSDRVSQLPDGILPPSARDRIARLALVWKFKMQVLERRLAESVDVLAAAGIDVTLMKGAALAVTVYRSFGERPMADLDLLVDPSVAHESHRLLQASGWALAKIPHPADAWRDHHHLPPLVDTVGSGLRLELHTAPLLPGSPFKLARTDIIETARWIELSGARVRVPDPHLHAVHAAVHFAYSHHFTSGAVNVFRDLVMLRESGGLTWDGFRLAAVRTGSETCCYWTLRLARALGGVVVPESLLSELSPQLGDRTSAVLEEHFSQLVLRVDHACPSVELRHRLWEFALQTKRSEIAASSALEQTPPSSARHTGSSALRRVAAHFRRAPNWSRYIVSVLGPVFELTA